MKKFRNLDRQLLKKLKSLVEIAQMSILSITDSELLELQFVDISVENYGHFSPEI